MSRSVHYSVEFSDVPQCHLALRDVFLCALTGSSRWGRLAWLLPVTAPVVAASFVGTCFASFAIGGVRWLRNSDAAHYREMTTAAADLSGISTIILPYSNRGDRESSADVHFCFHRDMIVYNVAEFIIHLP